MPSILAFAGSTRTDSLNKRLVRFAAEEARKLGADVTLIDLRDYSMPLYDGDLEAEQGPPEAASKLYDLMKSHQGLLLSCPEYNSSISGVLKNTIDWLSRPRAEDPRLAAFTGKVAALMSASPGALGGMRGLVHVRSILGNIGTLVLPNQAAISKAQDAFADDGMLNDQQSARRVQAVVAELVNVVTKLSV